MLGYKIPEKDLLVSIDSYWFPHSAGTSSDDRADCFNPRPIQEKPRFNVQGICFGGTQVRLWAISDLMWIIFSKNPYDTLNSFLSEKPQLPSKRKLVPWLKLILRNQTVVETLYQPWSYTVTTGAECDFYHSSWHLWGVHAISNFIYEVLTVHVISNHTQDSTMHSSCSIVSPSMCLTCR